MEEKIIGCITIGQSPRIDVVPEMEEVLPTNIKIIQAGALDTLTRNEIEKIYPEKDDYVLVTKLRDGESVKIAERHILPLLQNCIDKLIKENAQYIVFICTGEFNHSFTSSVPIVFPDSLLKQVVKPLLYKNYIAVITPDSLQVKQTEKKWESISKNVFVTAASPYENIENIKKAAEQIKGKDIDLIILDCIGYNKEMKKIVMETTSIPVILPRTIIARILTEVLSY